MKARMALIVWLSLVPAPVVWADDDARSKALLDKALQAHGGLDRLSQYRGASFRIQGKVRHSGEDVEFKGSWTSELPERLRMDVQVPFMGLQFNYSQVLDADKSWNALNENALDLSRQARAEACEQAWAYNVARLAPLSDRAIRFRWLGEGKVADRAVLGLGVQRRDRREVKLFFDKQNGLLLKSETRSRDLLDLDQEFVVETFYSDYRKVQGIAVAHKITMRRDGKPYMEMDCQDYKLAETLGDEAFVRP